MEELTQTGIAVMRKKTKKPRTVSCRYGAEHPEVRKARKQKKR